MQVSQTSSWLVCPHILKVRMRRRQDMGQLSRTISEKEVVVGHRNQVVAWWEIHERWIWSPVM